MPGLDYIVAALARMGFIRLWTAQTPPTLNQEVTVWLKPALPSWSAEATVWLWDGEIGAYALANPDLWTALLTNNTQTQQVQIVNVSADTVSRFAQTVVVEREAPTVTTLALPAVSLRSEGFDLRVVDWSVNIAEHRIILNPNGSDTVMRYPQFSAYSSADRRAGLTLRPIRSLSAWIIAP